MQYRTLGRAGLRVSVLGFGALRLPFDDAEASVEIIRYALDQGINLVDTAYVYGGGRREGIVAQATRGRGPARRSVSHDSGHATNGPRQ